MKKLHYLIIAALFIVTFSFILDIGFFKRVFPIIGITNIWYIQWTFLFFMCYVFACLRIFCFNWTYGLLALVCTYSAFFVGSQHPRCMLVLTQFIFALLGVEMVSKISYQNLNKILKSIIFLVLAQGLWVIVQTMNLDPFFNSTHDKMIDDTVGFSGSHNQIGLFFAMTMPLIISSFIYILPLSLFGLFKSTTAFAVAGAVVSCFFYIMFSCKKFIVSFLSIVILFSTLYFSFSDNIDKMLFKERFSLWGFLINSVNDGNILLNYNGQHVLIETHWAKGYGFGNFMRVAPLAQKEGFMDKIYEHVGFTAQHVYEHAHNDYIELFFETGYPGAISLMILILYSVYKFIRAKKTKILIIATSCIVAQMVTAMGIYTVQTAISGMLLIIFLGIFEKGVNNGKTNRDTVLASG